MAVFQVFSYEKIGFAPLLLIFPTQNRVRGNYNNFPYGTVGLGAIFMIFFMKKEGVSGKRTNEKPPYLYIHIYI